MTEANSTPTGAAQDADAWPFPRSAKRIALTGGSGRIGTALRRALAGKVAGITIVDRIDPGPLGPHETWEEVDITDIAALTRSFDGVDAVVHLAGHPNERSIEDILQVNVLGTHNVLEAARRSGVDRIVYGSSNHTVGFYPRDTEITEDVPMRPDTLYGLSKCWGELEAGLYYDKFGIRTLNVRIGNAADRPKDARAAKIWISSRDLAQLVLIGTEHPDITCTTVYGMSRAWSDWWDNTTAAALGYAPLDSARDVAGPEASIEAETDLPQVAEYFQGGRFCAIDHDGTRRSRLP
ncbi:uronate dehydrogenase [Palleronia marisminoris]|uniref:dTDP-glucose 4,6-dehydratase 2 n=1 Tax=Palleronia marisminoris TaxID=315423 RepID=A0A1Y5TR30_9RHOB|nr:NAD(P)-dependent oxidoreductase [Palleronia marisminoris]SFH49343.1 uronate dehydrogenase [Palleronia marisminoris]SLN69899.1 dTDP-glucose 4,6-dehydratase 2 [Palleronia marisminoris]